MTGFYLQMGTASVVWSGLAQGLGTGFVYVPLAAITFATLSPRLRNEGTAMFSLMRNIGSSIGISVVTTLLVRNTQVDAFAPRRAGDALQRRRCMLHAPGALDGARRPGRAQSRASAARRR